MGTCHIKLSNRSRCQQYISDITEHLIRCEVKQLCTCTCMCVCGGVGVCVCVCIRSTHIRFTTSHYTFGQVWISLSYQTRQLPLKVIAIFSPSTSWRLTERFSWKTTTTVWLLELPVSVCRYKYTRSWFIHSASIAHLHACYINVLL